MGDMGRRIKVWGGVKTADFSKQVSAPPFLCLLFGGYDQKV
jgi:hypothetical protein